MLYFIAWYLVITFTGMVTFPFIFRLFPALGDRGYAFSRILGLLVWGYAFWLLASLGIVRNNSTGILFSIIILLALSAWALQKGKWNQVKSWMHSNIVLVIGIEMLFLLAFAALAVVRAANPEAVGTEKPMELMFIQAILKSSRFPPHDAWLSGYAISYYYFGYVIIAMLAKITGTPGGIAFNLGISLIFALSAAGSYGVVHNLLASRRPANAANHSSTKHSRFSFPALLGPLFLLIVSNFEGFLHMLHNRGLFWGYDQNGGMTSRFWEWLDIKDLNVPPVEPLTWMPSRFWWWWRASRVVQDYDLSGNLREIIDEFPFFSYLLADLHPHVLVMPFALLAVALALNLSLGGGRGKISWLKLRLDLRTVLWAAVLALVLGSAVLLSSIASIRMLLVAAGIFIITCGILILFHFRAEIQARGLNIWLRPGFGEIAIGKILYLNTPTLLLSAFLLGAIAFLNTWDSLLFILLVAGSYNLVRILKYRTTISATIVESLWLALVSALMGIFFFFPFYLSFSSQAGGIIPNLIYATRGAHLWVHFGPLLVPIIIYLLYLYKPSTESGLLMKEFKHALLLVISFTLVLWLFSVTLGIAATYLPQISDLYLSTMAASSRGSLFPDLLTRRIVYPGAWLTLVAILSLALGLLLQFVKSPHRLREVSLPYMAKVNPFVSDAFMLLLLLYAALLVLGPEFIYLRDQFGWRINTIFKFYYQAWLLWSLAAAYGSAILLKKLQGPWAWIFRFILLVVVAMSLVYPLFSLWSKTGGFTPSLWTLDSSAYLAGQSPDEQAAIHWLENQPIGVVAEAVSPTGGSYTSYARISTQSGFPAVLGWIGHESQWRGGNEEMGSRQNDIQKLYCSRDWEETRQILNMHGIQYVVIGNLERSTYNSGSVGCPSGVNEAKFHQYILPVFQEGSMIIFRYNHDQGY